MTGDDDDAAADGDARARRGGGSTLALLGATAKQNEREEAERLEQRRAAKAAKRRRGQWVYEWTGAGHGEEASGQRPGAARERLQEPDPRHFHDRHARAPMRSELHSESFSLWDVKALEATFVPKYEWENQQKQLKKKPPSQSAAGAVQSARDARIREHFRAVQAARIMGMGSSAGMRRPSPRRQPDRARSPHATSLARSQQHSARPRTAPEPSTATGSLHARSASVAAGSGATAAATSLRQTSTMSSQLDDKDPMRATLKMPRHPRLAACVDKLEKPLCWRTKPITREQRIAQDRSAMNSVTRPVASAQPGEDDIAQKRKARAEQLAREARIAAEEAEAEAEAKRQEEQQKAAGSKRAGPGKPRAAAAPKPAGGAFSLPEPPAGYDVRTCRASRDPEFWGGDAVANAVASMRGPGMLSGKEVAEAIHFGEENEAKKKAMEKLQSMKDQRKTGFLEQWHAADQKQQKEKRKKESQAKVLRERREARRASAVGF